MVQEDQVKEQDYPKGLHLRRIFSQLTSAEGCGSREVTLGERAKGIAEKKARAEDKVKSCN